MWVFFQGRDTLRESFIIWFAYKRTANCFSRQIPGCAHWAVFSCNTCGWCNYENRPAVGSIRFDASFYWKDYKKKNTGLFTDVKGTSEEIFVYPLFFHVAFSWTRCTNNFVELGSQKLVVSETCSAQLGRAHSAARQVSFRMISTRSPNSSVRTVALWCPKDFSSRTRAREQKVC